MAYAALAGTSAPAVGGYKLDAGWMQSYGASLGGGFPTKDGRFPIIITYIELFVAGYSASRTVSLAVLGGGVTGVCSTEDFVVGSSSTPQASGFRQITGYMPMGGDLSVRITAGGAFRGGRAGGGSTSDEDGYVWSGYLSGGIYYAMAPSATRSLSAVADEDGDITLSWTAPQYTGDSAITNYVVEVSQTSDFSSILATITTPTAATSYVWSAGDPGETYYFRVAAKNYVSNAWGTTGLDSNVASATIGSAARRWDGDSEEATTTMVRWNGAAEVAITTAVRWDGTQEVPLS